MDAPTSESNVPTSSKVKEANAVAQTQHRCLQKEFTCIQGKEYNHVQTSTEHNGEKLEVIYISIDRTIKQLNARRQ